MKGIRTWTVGSRSSAERHHGLMYVVINIDFNIGI